MNKILAFIKALWTELDSVIELFVYLGIAYGIMKLLNLTYLQSISIVFIYFVLNLLRLLVEAFRNR
jgi:sorbitol-specific phosphotransferase system component IIC